MSTASSNSFSQLPTDREISDNVSREADECVTPRIHPPAVGGVPEHEVEGQVARGPETILVAEDDPFVRQVAARILREAGYAVLEAIDGEDALRVFEENRETVSLVLLDAVMPKLSGHDVYQHLRDRHPEVNTVFCTGYAPETVDFSLLASENVRLIQKPFSPNALLRSVRETLDSKPVNSPNDPEAVHQLPHGCRG